MSAPHQQTPSHSPTPSKSSLRRISNIQNASQRNLRPPPSPRFEDKTTTEIRYSPRSPPNQTLEYDSDDDDGDEGEDANDDATKPGYAQDPLLQQQDVFEHHEGSYFPTAVTTAAQEPSQPFVPLFTLIEDTVTQEHHHPAIHYIFADDDNEIITQAAVRSLNEDEPDQSSNTAQAKVNEEMQQHHDERLPPAEPGIKEHYLVLDIQPSVTATQLQSTQLHQQQTLPDDSLQQPSMQSQSTVRNLPFVVTSFTSFSPDWQISSASITSAPTMTDSPTHEDEGLMLRIEGRGFIPSGMSGILLNQGKSPAPANTVTTENPGGPGMDKGAEKEGESLEEMIERFQTNLAEIRKLMDTGLPVIIPTSPLDNPNQEAEGEIDPVVVTSQFDFDAQD